VTANNPHAAAVTAAPYSLSRSLAAEGLGTAFLLMAVVGSGIMAESLSNGNVALALLANAVATGTALVALITTFGPVSGAHFNPVVTLVERLSGRISTAHAASYAGVQVLAALAGVLSAHLMFGEAMWQVSTHARSGGAQLWSEVVATVGLVSVISGVSRHAPAAIPGVVGAYITAAYWFTASTSFANPAVTIARAFTDTFAGIRPADVPGFVAAQLVGGVAAWVCWRWLLDPVPPRRG
jgi:glycerol uptake facilitator-like aquaporin